MERIERLRIIVPWTPPTKLRPNAGAHWATKNKLRKEGRDAVIVAVRKARNDHDLFGEDVLFTDRARLTFVVRWGKGRQEWDPDGLSSALKGPCDGLTQSHVIQDDGPTYVEWAPMVQGKDPAGVGYTEITIEAIGAMS